jgi:hypothetical protein
MQQDYPRKAEYSIIILALMESPYPAEAVFRPNLSHNLHTANDLHSIRVNQTVTQNPLILPVFQLKMSRFQPEFSHFEPKMKALPLFVAATTFKSALPTMIGDPPQDSTGHGNPVLL